MRSARENLSIVAKEHQKAMITPVSPLRTRLIHISIGGGTGGRMGLGSPLLFLGGFPPTFLPKYREFK